MIVIHYISSISQRTGWFGTYIKTLAKELGKLCELHIITHQFEDDLELQDCHIHYIEKFHVSSFGREMKKDFQKILSGIQPDIVHINLNWKPDSSYAVKWAKDLGFKVVLQTHGMLEPCEIKKNYLMNKLPALSLYLKKAVVNADMLIATSEVEKNNLLSLNYNRSICLVPYGVDLEKVTLRKDWKRYKLIFFLALLHPNKGADMLLRAVANLRERLVGYKVIIGGSGNPDYVGELKDMVLKYKMDDVVDVCGPIYNEQKWFYYQHSDVFVLPTLNENFEIVVAEALASGTPVITTKGAPWHEIESCHCGWRIERNDEELVKALDNALDISEQEREQMGRNGRKLIKEKYSSCSIVKQLLLLYNNC